MNGRNPQSNPVIIQGGMGAAVSSWPLAKAVASAGQLGVVSGTGLDTVISRRLQLGDSGGHIRRALAHFPIPGIAERILERHFIPGGKPADAPFKIGPKPGQTLSAETAEMLIVANFVEVFLAKEGHDGLVGVNHLEKIQTVILPSLFGAMLAGVDYVLMGAGIPRTIPGVLDRLSRLEPVEIPLHVEGATSEDNFTSRFDPATLLNSNGSTESGLNSLKRPQFLAIVSSKTLATMLARKANGRVDGFIVEGASAGGHNAPPRGKTKYNHRGEPIYTHRDMIEPASFCSLDQPFWLAGSYGTPAHLAEALDAGAAGIQVGTAFAFCEESSLDSGIKRHVIESARRQTGDVFTDPLASPAGFPFKVLQYPESLSDAHVYKERARVCDMGYLRHAYRKEDGTIGWRCPAEKPEQYVRKGGEAAETTGRKCLCNALLANVSLGQVRADGTEERPLLTCGDDVDQIVRFLPTPQATAYSAHDVLADLLAEYPNAGLPAVQTTQERREGLPSVEPGANCGMTR